MTTQEVTTLIESHGLTFEQFVEWMFGQTVGMNEDGSTNWYDDDVQRFIRNHK
jgi:NOL1/NOP2/fmu family ribosome biogenesis protein